jgi:hypothetical protein
LHELEIANNNPRKHGNFFGAQARKRGWDTDGEAVNRVYCPDCRKTPAWSRSRRQVELDSVVIPAMSEPPVIDGYAEPVPALPPPEQERPHMPRDHIELTSAQRLEIRRMLDQFFDDKEGCYLPNADGEAISDQAIGQCVGVPWAEVTKIREAAYGKILIDPELAALRNQMASLDAEMAALSKHMLERIAEAERRAAEIRVALDSYGRKTVGRRGGGAIVA